MGNFYFYTVVFWHLLNTYSHRSPVSLKLSFPYARSSYCDTVKEALGSLLRSLFNTLLPLTAVTITYHLYLTLSILPKPLKDLWAKLLLVTLQPVICTIDFPCFSLGTGKYYSRIWQSVRYFYSLCFKQRDELQ